MASSSQAAPAFVGGHTTSEWIAGCHDLRINNFSATKDLSVGKSIKSSTFRLGGYAWYIECFPCGVDENRAGMVHLKLCRQEDHHGSRLSGYCRFTLMDSLKKGWRPSKSVIIADGPCNVDLIERTKLDSLLKYDFLQVRCIVVMNRFPAAPQLEPASEIVAGSHSHSHVLTVDGYSKIRGAYHVGDSMDSKFSFAGRRWCIRVYPRCEYEDEISAIYGYICLDKNEPARNDEVKVRFQMALLTHDGQIISAIQDLYTFSDTNHRYPNLLSTMEPESSPLLQEGIKIRCDMAVVEGGTTAMPNLLPAIGGDLHGGSQQLRVRCDVTFEAGGHLFPAHKCVLATRCTAFMAVFFDPSGNENIDVTDQILHVDDMEPRVFQALLHFIYTDALPEVDDADKVAMAQGLLVAADRYAMERLKMICGDLLCSCINDARMAITTLDLADKHGCRRLKEVCMKFLMEYHAN